jgi:hypothetical protein
MSMATAKTDSSAGRRHFRDELAEWLEAREDVAGIAVRVEGPDSARIEVWTDPAARELAAVLDRVGGESMAHHQRRPILLVAALALRRGFKPGWTDHSRIVFLAGLVREFDVETYGREDHVLEWADDLLLEWFRANPAGPARGAKVRTPSFVIEIREVRDSVR